MMNLRFILPVGVRPDGVISVLNHDQVVRRAENNRRLAENLRKGRLERSPIEHVRAWQRHLAKEEKRREKEEEERAKEERRRVYEAKCIRNAKILAEYKSGVGVYVIAKREGQTVNQVAELIKRAIIRESR